MAAARPRFAQLVPILPDDVKPPLFGPACLFKITDDGYRCAAEVDGSRAQLSSRSATVMTAWSPEVVPGLASFKDHRIFDGQICAGADRVTFVAFDMRLSAHRLSMPDEIAPAKAMDLSLKRWAALARFIDDAN